MVYSDLVPQKVYDEFSKTVFLIPESDYGFLDRNVALELSYEIVAQFGMPVFAHERDIGYDDGHMTEYLFFRADNRTAVVFIVD